MLNECTEEDAAKRWCPFARVSVTNSYGHAGVNRGRDPIMEEAHCISSSCMAWRWLDNHGNAPVLGFCGLAGQSKGE